MLRKICPVCGRETDVLIEGVCPDCYRLTHRIIDVPNEVNVLMCYSCGAYFINGRWSRGIRSLEKLVSSKIRVKGIVSDMSIRVFRDEAKIKVKGKASELMPNSYEEEYTVKLMFKRDLCPSCRAELMEKEEAIIQLRLIGGDLSEFKAKVMDIVRMTLAKGEDRGRVIKIEDVNGGFDIKITNQRLARSIALNVHRELPSFMQETSKVVGYRGDKRIEKRSISIHLIGLSKGEVININGADYLIKSLHKDHVDLVKLSDGSLVGIKYSKLTQAKLSQVKDYSISCSDGKVIISINGLQYTLNNVNLICPQ
ncbi:60S ribosomal export protein NMD3 [Caldivirga maquilingensis]|uniref:NMD3 n=1 Tax=Caldivirga maquilingensis (strain ATCC 700844 / DSM 13496 / JCM 10307 / IC-167) TaxID=397948 RepID=A8MAV9_CALMQ|nr:60S ribosomal export protein NMD3 [Caldivirga maquilingensis]ABW02588.1 NMD3 [Caldivirga maquilingensis IC-167]